MVHGGAGRMPDDPARIERMRAGAGAGVEAGYAVLSAGGSALDAVEAAVVALEDDPEFNAGHGAALTEDGRVELDASVMEGTRRAGSVACVAGVRNPVRAGARRARGGPPRPVRRRGRPSLRRARAASSCATTAGTSTDASAGCWPRATRAGRPGRSARWRATSTASWPPRRPPAAPWASARGRVGDSPLIGAGTWADDESVAVSCTGDGEAIIRVAMAHEVDALVRLGGLSPREGLHRGARGARARGRPRRADRRQRRAARSPPLQLARHDPRLAGRRRARPHGRPCRLTPSKTRRTTSTACRSRTSSASATRGSRS